MLKMIEFVDVDFDIYAEQFAQDAGGDMKLLKEEPRGPRYDASQSRDRDPAEDENAGDDNAPENMSQEEYNRRMESENPEELAERTPRSTPSALLELNSQRVL